MSLDAARAAELAKYPPAYARPRYRMGGPRRADAERDLAALAMPLGRRDLGAYLDVGCGRGEMLDFAAGLGFDPVRGIETVPALIDGGRVVQGLAHALPFGPQAFAVASMFDVIEHLVPGDDEAACRELARVATRHILISANNRTSVQPDGTELHVNRRPYDQWDVLFRQWFAPHQVTWIKGPGRYVSETWRIDLRA